jgi:hypothetical protein
MRFFPFAPSQITDWDWLYRGINSDLPHFKWDRATKQALTCTNGKEGAGSEVGWASTGLWATLT